MDKLVIIGYAPVYKSADGKYLTREFYKDYLSEMNQFFPNGIIAVMPYGKDDSFNGALNDIGVDVLINYPERTKQLALILKVITVCQSNHVYINMPLSAFLAVFMPIIRRIAKSVTIGLEDDPYSWRGKLRISRIPGADRLFEKITEHSLKVSDLVIARGRYLCQVAKMYNSNVVESYVISHIKPIPVDAPETKSANEKHILFIGTLVARKNLVQLQRVLAQLAKDKPNTNKFHLHVLGSGSLMDESKKIAKKLSDAYVTHFYGWVEDRQLIESRWLLADALVSPTNGSEGVPRVIDEAIARDVPCIATRVGGNAHEFVDGEICLIEKDDDKQLKDYLNKVLFDEAYKKELSEKSKSRREMLLNTKTSAAQQHGELISRL